MPNRLIREGMIDSPRMETLAREGGWAAEVFYRRLQQVADDYGRFDGRVSMLKARCYPTLLDTVRDADIEKWLTSCIQCGLVHAYFVKGVRYVEVCDFRQRRRANGSKFPSPPTQGGDGPEPEGESPAPVGEGDKEAKTEDTVDASPVVMEFPIRAAGGRKSRMWPLTLERVNEYRELYPSIDLDFELKRAKKWAEDNPTQRKSHNGMAGFITRWLNKAYMDSQSRRSVSANGASIRRQAINEGINDWVSAE